MPWAPVSACFPPPESLRAGRFVVEPHLYPLVSTCVPRDLYFHREGKPFLGVSI